MKTYPKRSSLLLAALLCLALVAAGSTAQAEVQSDGCVEWFADTSPMIGIYSVTAVSRKITDHLARYTLTLHLEEGLKGQPPATVSSEYFRTGDEEKDAPAMEKGSRFLVFMKADETAKLRIDKQVWLLRQPKKPWAGSWILDARFHVLGDEETILRETHRRINTNHRPQPLYYGMRGKMVEAPMGAAQGLVGKGDAFLLVVPEDLLRETEAVRDVLALRNALQSYKAANGGALPPNKGNAAIMAALLKKGPEGGADFARESPTLNAAGEFLDPWGTPYRIDTSNPEFPRIYSAGPDKMDSGGAAGSDDIASWDL